MFLAVKRQNKLSLTLNSQNARDFRMEKSKIDLNSCNCVGLFQEKRDTPEFSHIQFVDIPLKCLSVF